MNRLNPILVMVVIFLLTIALATYDPLNLNPDGLDGESILVALYALPAFLAVLFLYIIPYYKK